jgi:hypothetical protein
LRLDLREGDWAEARLRFFCATEASAGLVSVEAGALGTGVSVVSAGGVVSAVGVAVGVVVASVAGVSVVAVASVGLSLVSVEEPAPSVPGAMPAVSGVLWPLARI